MSLYIYPTDHDWYRFLAGRPDIDEVNFWQPGGSAVFNRLQPGEMFLFRLKHPINRIAGGGFFLHASLLPVDLAWEAFGEKNGVSSLTALQDKIAAYKRLHSASELTSTHQIGCIILGSPFFLREADWLSVPSSYSPNLVQGKRYSENDREGKDLLEAIQLRLPGQLRGQEFREETVRPALPRVKEGPVWSDPVLARRRLGQGTFRVVVTDAYERRCAITGERTLPVLEAAHVRPISRSGQHAADNGLLLRSDIHTLFDRGYVTVTPQFEFRVSPRLRNDWHNGVVYYELDRKTIRSPAPGFPRPAPEHLEWHADTVFLG